MVSVLLASCCVVLLLQEKPSKDANAPTSPGASHDPRDSSQPPSSTVRRQVSHDRSLPGLADATNVDPEASSQTSTDNEQQQLISNR